jgi:hypothetical protein
MFGAAIGRSANADMGLEISVEDEILHFMYSLNQKSLSMC